MTECFELVYHGGGGYNWFDVWEMPVPHRRFNLMKINEHLKRIEDLKNEQNNTLTETSKVSRVNLPSHLAKSNSDNTFVSTVKSKK